MTSTPSPPWADIPYEGIEGPEFGDQFWTGGKKFTWTTAGVADDDGGFWLEEDLPPFATRATETKELK